MEQILIVLIVVAGLLASYQTGKRRGARLYDEDR
jgi:hypothetical protein